MMKNWIRQWKLLAIIGIGCALTACNEDSAESDLKETYPENGFDYREGKVLWIVMDGAGGKAVQQAYNERIAPNIRSMVQHSIYTFEGLADTRVDTLVDERLAWDNLLTGTTAHTADTPSVLERMKEASDDVRIAVYAGTDYVKEACGPFADRLYVGASDAETVAETVKDLSGGEAAALTIVELTAAQEAGRGGFFAEDGTPARQVTEAVGTIDGQIGDIMEAIENRPEYGRENWLVILTSDYGGGDNSGSTVYDMGDRNTFTLMYNAGFDSQLLQRPADNADAFNYVFYTPVFAERGATGTATVNDPTLFDFVYGGEAGGYTIQFMYRSLTYNYRGTDTFVSKAVMSQPTWNDAQSNGWEIRQNNAAGYVFQFDGFSTSSSDDVPIIDREKQFHVVTAVIDFDNRECRLYADGQNTSVKTLSEQYLRSIAVGSQGYTLTVGGIARSAASETQFNVTNLQIYDVALPADYIAANYKQTNLETKAGTLAYWNNLIGYWPMDREEEYRENTLRDYSQYGSVAGGVNAGRSDMTLSSDAVWLDESSAQPNVSPVINSSYYRAVINLVDIPYQTFQWLEIPVLDDWGWDGVAHQLPYSSLQ